MRAGIPRIEVSQRQISEDTPALNFVGLVSPPIVPLGFRPIPAKPSKVYPLPVVVQRAVMLCVLLDGGGGPWEKAVRYERV